MKKNIQVFKETFTEFGEDKAPRLGAALAYYTVFSIGPMLLIAISMAGIFLGQEAAQGKIGDELRKVFGPQMADAVQKMIVAANKPKSGMIATVVGIVTLLLGASGVIAQLKDALNTIWNVEPKKSAGIMGAIKEKFFSVAVVFGVGFLLLVTLVFDTIIAAMGHLIEGRIPGGEALLQAIQLAVSFGLITVLFAAMFKYLPDIEISWRDVWVGAALTSLLFVIGKFGLGMYLGKAAVGSSYGAAGSLVILLIWVYWSAQIVFFGAEFTQVYARRFGSMQGDTSKRDARAKAAKPEDRPRDTRTSAAPTRPSSAPAPAMAKSGGGGAGKLVAGGAAGMAVGTLGGLLAGVIVALKLVKKVVTIPFR